MRWAMLSGLLGFVVGAAVVVDGYLPDGPHLPAGPTNALSVLIFAPAGLCLGYVLYYIGDKKIGRQPSGELWPKVRAVTQYWPWWLRAVVGILFVLTSVNMLIGFIGPVESGTDGPVDQAGFLRVFAGNLAFIGLGGAALCYGYMKRSKAQQDSI